MKTLAKVLNWLERGGDLPRRRGVSSLGSGILRVITNKRRRKLACQSPSEEGIGNSAESFLAGEMNLNQSKKSKDEMGDRRRQSRKLVG